MEKNASQRSNELEQERLRKWLELELAMVRSELEDSRAVQEKMEFVLQIERAKCQQLEEKHAKNKVMKEKLIKKIAQIEESALKVVSSNKQVSMNSEFWELLECEKARGEVTQCQLLVDLADTKKKLAVLEASLEVKTHLCSDLEQEKVCMQRDMLMLEKTVQESKNLFDQSEHGIRTMKCALDNKEQDVLTMSQKLQEAVSASEVLDKTIRAQEMSLQLMEIENAKLKDVVNEQANRFPVLQKEAEKATLTNKDLTQHLSRAVQKQTLLYIYAHGQLKEKGSLLLNERQKASKAKAQQEVLQERLEKMQNEGTLLSQQLEAANQKAEAKEQEVMQERLKTMHTESEVLALQDKMEKMQNEGTLLSQQLEAANQKAEAKEQEIMQEHLKTMHTENEVLVIQERLEKVQKENRLLSDQLETANKKAEAKEQEVMQKHLKTMHTRNDMLALQDRLEKVLNEGMKLSQQLETANKIAEAKEQELADMRERLKTMYTENEVLALQDKMEKVLNEGTLLSQQLEVANEKAAAKEQEVMQERLKTMHTENEVLVIQERLEKVQKENRLLSEQLETANKKAEAKEQEVMQKHLKTIHTRNDMLALQDRLEKVLNEGMKLSQQLETANKIAEAKEQELADMRERLKTMHTENEVLVIQERLEKVQKENTLLSEQLETANKKAEAKEQEVMQEHLKTMHTEKELLCLQERLEKVENERMILSQQLEAANQKAEAKEQEVMQEHLKMMHTDNEMFALQERLDEVENESMMLSQQLEAANQKAEAKEQEIMQDCLKTMHTRNEMLALQERLEKVLNEGTLVSQQLEAANKKAEAKEAEVADMQEHLKAMHSEKEMAETSKEKLTELLAQVRRDGWSTLWKLQQHLTDTQTKLTTCEGLLEMHPLHCSDLEEENISMEKDISTLKQLLQENEDSCTQSESFICELIAKLNEKDNEIVTASQKLLVSLDSRNKEPALEMAEIQEQPHGGDTDRWDMVWQLQQKLADAKINLLTCEASLKVNTNHCRDLEEEKESMQKDVITLKGTLREMEDMYAQSEQHVHNLMAFCDEKDYQICTLSEQPQVSSASKSTKMSASKKAEVHDGEEKDIQNTQWQLQKELAATKIKLSVHEASLKVKAKHCRNLDEENRSMTEDINALKGKLWEGEDKCAQSEQRVCNLTGSCEDKDHQIHSLFEKLQACSNSSGKDLKNTENQDHLDSEETNIQNTVWQIQQELADTKTKLSTCEASLKVSANYCRDLQEEKQSMQKDINTLKRRLWESVDKCAQSEDLAHSMMTSCAEKDHQICALSKQLEVLTALKGRKSKKTRIQDSEEIDRQNTAWQQQQELADTKTKLATCEASLKVKAEHCTDLEEENQSMQKDIVSLKERLWEREDKCMQLEQGMQNIITSEDTDYQNHTLSKKLHAPSGSKRKEPDLKNTDIQEHLDSEETERWNTLWQLQNELADTKAKLLTCEAALKMNTNGFRNLEEENQSMQRDKVTLKGRLHESKETCAQLEQHICNLMASCDDKNNQICALSKELQVLSASKSKKSQKVKIQDTVETDKQNMLWQLQQELVDTKTKLATCEASLKVKAKHCRDLEEEKQSMQKDIVTLKGRLYETENMHAQSEQHICKLIASCDDKDHQICTLSKELQVLSASVGIERTFEQAEESQKTLCQLEAEIINLQAMAEQQTSVVAALQKETAEATRVKKDLEELNQQMKEQIPLNADEQMKERIAALREEKEKAILQQEAFEKQLEDVQNEKKVLHQQLKEAQMKEAAREKTGTDVQNDRFTKMQAHYEKKVKELEKRSEELAYRYAALQEHPGSDKTDREHNWRKVKQDLVDMQSKSLVENVSLEVISRHCSNLENQEQENMDLDLESLNGMIKECENFLFI
ncbi:myosin-11-like [Anguilla rostrata]|uniref:myosin-11-like n=1 Tax=Anguilla rostrata TaxID=7938 RepID=UPI0030CE612C